MKLENAKIDVEIITKSSDLVELNRLYGKYYHFKIPTEVADKDERFADDEWLNKIKPDIFDNRDFKFISILKEYGMQEIDPKYLDKGYSEYYTYGKGNIMFETGTVYLDERDDMPIAADNWRDSFLHNYGEGSCEVEEDVEEESDGGCEYILHVTTNFRTLVDNDLAWEVDSIADNTDSHIKRFCATISTSQKNCLKLMGLREFTVIREEESLNEKDELTYILPKELNLPEGIYTLGKEDCKWYVGDKKLENTNDLIDQLLYMTYMNEASFFYTRCKYPESLSGNIKTKIKVYGLEKHLDKLKQILEL
jgi:hypothetical protein